MAKGFKLAEAFVEIRTDNGKFNSGLKTVRRDLQVAQGAMKSLAGVGKAAFLGLAAGLGVGAGIGLVSALQSMVTGTIAGERAQQKLRSVLRSTGNEVTQNSARLNDLAEGLKGVTNIDDDAIRSVIALGLNLGIGADQIDNATKAAIGLSEATGMDLEASMEALTKALYGNFTALEKQIPSMRKTLGAEQKLIEIQKLAERGLAQRAASTNTLGGATEQLSMAFGDLAKSVGGKISPALVGATRDATAFTKALTIGTLENKSFLIDLERRVLKVRQAMLSFIGQGDPKIDERISALDKEEIDATNEKIRAEGELSSTRLEGLRKYRTEVTKSFTDAADIARRAQETALEGAAGLASAAAGVKATPAPSTKTDPKSHTVKPSGTQHTPQRYTPEEIAARQKRRLEQSRSGGPERTLTMDERQRRMRRDADLRDQLGLNNNNPEVQRAQERIRENDDIVTGEGSGLKTRNNLRGLRDYERMKAAAAARREAMEKKHQEMRDRANQLPPDARDIQLDAMEKKRFQPDREELEAQEKKERAEFERQQTMRQRALNPRIDAERKRNMYNPPVENITRDGVRDALQNKMGLNAQTKVTPADSFMRFLGEKLDKLTATVANAKGGLA